MTIDDLEKWRQEKPLFRHYDINSPWKGRIEWRLCIVDLDKPVTEYWICVDDKDTLPAAIQAALAAWD